MNNNKFIIGISDGEHEYTVNGVKYVVSSKFKQSDFNNIKDTLTEKIEKYIKNDFAHWTDEINGSKIEKYIKNDFAHWTDEINGSKIDTECVSTAGKEV